MCEKTGIPGLGERAVNVQRQERGWGSDGTTALAEVRGTARQRPGPHWDYNMAEGKERLRIYRQTLLGGSQSGRSQAH
ncbi:unnamed protein product [Rangifer tarandus platyrhynchus]|uniref:Uncharacterized protein n=1 Tax=Rangifer tarandus platyrhynchus TaxID=3082113 RepID=A0AC59ZZD7_RANTA